MADKLSFLKRRDGGQALAVLTAYDYPTARILDEAGVDMLLVGDSLGMVVLGYPDTTQVSLAEMLHHVRAVRRGVERAIVLGDMPYGSYDTPKEAVATAKALVDAGADCVKLEGGVAVANQVEAIRAAGIEMIGHVGMLPQHIKEEGRYRKKGKTEAESAMILADAQKLDALGVRSMVVESVVPSLAKEITEVVKVPTIGIGAGSGCDGQVLVIHDLIGAFPWFCPPFAKPKADVAGEIRRAAQEYLEEVRKH